jgi:predicted O-methyltransferase YrrM
VEQNIRVSVEALARSLSAARLESLRLAHNRDIERIELLRRDFASSGRAVTYFEYGMLDSSGIQTEPAPTGVELTVTAQHLVQTSGMLPDRLVILLSLVRSFEPDLVVELGTCAGMSAAYVLAGLEANRHGRLVTLEGSPVIARLAEDNLAHLGFSNFEVVSGRHQDLLQTTLECLPSVDLAVVDAEHSEPGTLWAHGMLSEHLSGVAVMFYDDIRWSPSMTRAWARMLQSESGVAAAADLGEVGVLLCVRGHVGPPQMISARSDAT